MQPRPKPPISPYKPQLTQGQKMLNQATVKIDRFMLGIQRYFQEIMLRARQPIETMYQVALQRISEGAYEDALYRLHIVVRRRPDNAEAWYHLGSCAMETENMDEAVMAFRNALQLDPSNDDARFLLTVIEPNALKPDQQPKYAPLDLARGHFDSMAEYFEEEQLDGLSYSGHQVMAELVRKYLNPNYQNFQILDIGCGTGLLGPLFRDIAGYIKGVDISPLMLEVADLKRDALARKTYDELINEDLRKVLLESKEQSVDLVLAANVFPYVGGLTPVFEGAKRVLRHGGIFAFSLEPMDGNDFGLVPYEGRFAHSDAYIRELAKTSGFDVLEATPFELYHETKAVQYVLRKPSSQQAQPTQPQQAQAPAAPQQEPPKSEES